ncbi:MAG TPA: M23 family metallopeptidase [Candidatus Absconditabacterales bacterium]|nr:M23 family metallopeptidase [Candidatus Absconditabacterales bacterium]
MAKYTLASMIMGSLLTDASITKFPEVGAYQQFIYPIKKVSKLECRTQYRDTLTENCKQDLPIVRDAYFSNYENKKGYKEIITTLRGATYTNQRDIGSGAHPGIDIATARGTPVYSIADGEVYSVGRNSAYGNVIKIKHGYKNEVIYSIYAHLDEILVTEGQKITQGSLIGKVGNTGRVFGQLGGYHLNFEIQRDNKGRPAYFFKDCKDLEKGEVYIINNGLCRAELAKNSYDPIRLIENNFSEKSLVINETLVVSSDKNLIPETVLPTINDEEKNTEQTTAEWQEIQFNASNIALKDLLSQNKLFILKPKSNKIKVGEKAEIIIKIENKNLQESSTKILPKPITILSSNNSIKPDIASIQILPNGIQKISLSAQNKGKSVIIITLENQKIFSTEITIE